MLIFGGANTYKITEVCEGLGINGLCNMLFLYYIIL